MIISARNGSLTYSFHNKQLIKWVLNHQHWGVKRIKDWDLTQQLGIVVWSQSKTLPIGCWRIIQNIWHLSNQISSVIPRYPKYQIERDIQKNKYYQINIRYHPKTLLLPQVVQLRGSGHRNLRDPGLAGHLNQADCITGCHFTVQW